MTSGWPGDSDVTTDFCLWNWSSQQMEATDTWVSVLRSLATFYCCTSQKCFAEKGERLCCWDGEGHLPFHKGARLYIQTSWKHVVAVAELRVLCTEKQKIIVPQRAYQLHLLFYRLIETIEENTVISWFVCAQWNEVEILTPRSSFLEVLRDIGPLSIAHDRSTVQCVYWRSLNCSSPDHQHITGRNKVKLPHLLATVSDPDMRHAGQAQRQGMQVFQRALIAIWNQDALLGRLHL